MLIDITEQTALEMLDKIKAFSKSVPFELMEVERILHARIVLVETMHKVNCLYYERQINNSKFIIKWYWKWKFKKYKNKYHL